MNTDKGHGGRQCQICGSRRAGSLRSASSVRQAVARLIASERGNWEPEGWVCIDDLQRYQQQYVESVLKAEKGELTQLEHEVLESLRGQETVSVNPEEEFGASLSLFERVGDRMADFGRSRQFLTLFVAGVLSWMGLNSWLLVAQPFDPYPYILLNLCLSCIAALQAPVIMMSQKRQEARDRIGAARDYQVNLKAELEIRHLHQKLDHLLSNQWDRLMEVQEIQLQLLNELRGRVGEAPRPDFGRGTCVGAGRYRPAQCQSRDIDAISGVCRGGPVPIRVPPLRPSARLTDPQQILRFIVVIGELTLVGVVQCIAQLTSNMDVRGRYHQASVLVVDGHDSFERVLVLLVRLVMAHQAHQFVTVACDERTRKCQVAGGQSVPDAVACRAQGRMRGCLCGPLPTSMNEHRTAIRAARAVGELEVSSVRVVNALRPQFVASDRAPVLAGRVHHRFLAIWVAAAGKGRSSEMLATGLRHRVTNVKDRVAEAFQGPRRRTRRRVTDRGSRPALATGRVHDRLRRPPVAVGVALIGTPSILLPSTLRAATYRHLIRVRWPLPRHVAGRVWSKPGS